MAVIELRDSGERFALSPRHVIGRAPGCSLRIEDPRVSAFHVELIWDGRGWMVQDLGSRNGTVVGARQLSSGEQVPISVGLELTLAGHQCFVLVDDSPPALLASAPDGEVRVAEHDILSLPSDEEPELTVYRDIDDSWVVESKDGTRPAREDEPVFAGGRAWRLLLPVSVPETRELDELRLHGLELRFSVSRDGEHVELRLVSKRGEAIVVEARAHLALILVLARARLGDGEAGLPASEAGWVYRDELPRMLGVQPHMVNLWIHRARRQLAQLGVRDAATMIERRANATQLRLAAARLRIEDA